MPIALKHLLTVLVLTLVAFPAHGEEAPGVITPSAGEQALSDEENDPYNCLNLGYLECGTPCFCDCEPCATETQIIKMTYEYDSCENHGLTSKGQSVIDNMTLNHIHDAKDWAYAKPSGSGCTTCSQASPGQEPTGILLDIRRYHRYRDVTQRSSFGPGVFMNFDISLTIQPNLSGNHIMLFNPSSMMGFLFLEDGNYGDAKDGIYRDGLRVNQHGRKVKDARLYTDWNGGGSLTTDWTAGKSLVRTDLTGKTYIFEVIDLGSPQGIGQTLPNAAPWRHLDVGRAALAGSASTTGDGSVFTVTAGGNDIGNTNDQFQFVYQALHGDGSITAKVDSMEGLTWAHGANAGVMIRESLHESARFLLMSTAQTYSGQMEWRTTAGASAGSFSSGSILVAGQPMTAINPPCWTRVTRVGSQITGYLSTDGVSWYPIGTKTIDFGMDVYVGLAVNARIEASLRTAVFSNVSMDGAPTDPSAWPDTQLYRDIRGRLARIEEPNGYGIDLTYRYNPIGHPATTVEQQNAIQIAPDRQWQINTISDPTGRQIVVDYHPAQVSGQWVVSSITVPGGKQIGYQYGADGHLAQVHFPDDTVSTFVRAYDPATRCITMSYDDAGADGTHRRKTAYLTSNFSIRVDTNSNVIRNQASQLVRMVVNGAGEVSYLNGFDQSLYNRLWVYEGAGRLRQMTTAATNCFFAPGWTYDPAQSGAAAWVGTLTPSVFSLNLGGWGNFSRNTPAGSTDARGVTRSFTYDADGLQLGVAYSDGTSETCVRNGLKQITRLVDRLGRVTLTSFDNYGNTTREETGIRVVDGVDVPQADHAVRQWEYYPDGHANQRLLAVEIDANGNRTDYAYDAHQRLISVTDPPDQSGGTRAVTTFAYDAAGRLHSTTDPRGIATTYAYDDRDRIASITYADGSSERFAYGAPNTPDANLLVKRIDRNGVVTTYAYDLAGRRTATVVAAAKIVHGAEVPITDPAVRQVETCSYLPGTDKESSCTRAGELIAYGFDEQQRVVSRTVTPRTGAALTSTTTYINNLPQITTDAYGRSTWTVYRASDARPIRTVQALVPGFQVADLAALATLPRDLSANPAYIIEDVELDAAGQVTARINGRGVRTAYALDTHGRITAVTEDALGLPATTQFTYDDVGNRLTVTSPRGVESAMTYTGRNLLASVTEAANIPGEATLTRLMTYTATRKLWREWDANNASKPENDESRRGTTYGYGGCCDRLVSITDPVGNITAFQYDFVGNRTHVTDPNTLTTVTTYDARNRVASVTNAANEPTTFTYDDNLTDGVGIDAVASVSAVLPSLGLGAGADGSAVAVTNPALETSYELRDGLGRTIARIDPLGHATRVAYDTVITTGDGTGLVETAVTSATGHTTRSQADGAGRVRRSIDALGNVATSGFDAVGNQVTFRDANQVGWNASYNGRNWLLSRSDTRPTETNITDWGYDLDGNRVSETNALGKTEFYDYDHRNRRTRITDRLAGITRFAYDLVGNLTQISDADNEIRGGLAHLEGCTQYAYDPRNLLVAEAFPAGQTGRTLRAYGYDAGRRLTTRNVGTLSGAFSATAAFATTPEATTYQYDNANRLTTRGYPADGKNDTFEYDLASRLTKAISARYASTVDRNYDDAGRLDDESLTLANVQRTGTTVSPAIWTVGYTYDADNRVTGLSYPTGSTVARAYTDRDELDTVSLNGQPVIDRTYDTSGRLTQSTLSSGLAETRTYIAGTHMTADIIIAGVTGFTYTYDATRRKLTEGDGIRTVTQTFGYDDAGRLTAWSDGINTQSWNLSLVGNWNTTTRNGVPEARVHSKVHEATQVGPNILAYDRKGNLEKDERQTGMTWDPENRLIRAVVTPDASITGFGTVATYRYDALGRRVAKTVQNRTTYFLPAGAQTVVELEQTAVPSQAQVTGNEADGTTANAALPPASGGILPYSDTQPVTRVNFQPQTTPIPAGFLADTGKISAARTNGLTYGWSSDATAQAVIRNGAVPLVEFDTHIQLAPGQSWTIALPNGTYPVVVVAGDPLSTQQTNNLTINGQTLTDPDPASNPGYSAGDFDGWAVLVTVTNGTMTIAPAANAVDAKLCFIEIGTVGTTIATETQDKLAVLITRATSETGANPPSTDPLTKDFVYGSYVDEVVAYQTTVGVVSSRYYLHYNHLYSVAALTDSTGAVVERYTYDAYGRQTITSAGGVSRSKSAVGFDRGFTGYVTDNETGLLHARARQYSPTLGRFIGRDPIGYRDGLGLYGAYFVPGSIDPMGLWTLEGVLKVLCASKEGRATVVKLREQAITKKSQFARSEQRTRANENEPWGEWKSYDWGAMTSGGDTIHMPERFSDIEAARLFSHEGSHVNQGAIDPVEGEISAYATETQLAIATPGMPPRPGFTRPGANGGLEVNVQGIRDWYNRPSSPYAGWYEDTPTVQWKRNPMVNYGNEEIVGPWVCPCEDIRGGWPNSRPSAPGGTAQASE